MQRFAEHNQLRLFVGQLTADIVHLYKIHAPARVQLKNAVVISPRAVLADVYSVHIGIPRAYAVEPCDITRGLIASLYREIVTYCLTGYASHNVNPEFQTQRVNILRERRKALSARRRRKSVLGGYHPRILVDTKVGERVIFVTVSRRLVPLDVHHDILPTVLLKIFRHKFGVGAYGSLIYRSSVAVPAVPPHGRRFCNHTFPPYFNLKFFATRPTQLTPLTLRYAASGSRGKFPAWAVCPYFLNAA